MATTKALELAQFGTNLVVDGATGVATQSSLTLSGTTASTSTTTGSLVTLGGAGIAENLYVGGNTVISGDIGAVNATLSGDIGAVNATLSGNLGAVNTTLSGYLRGPASFVIDPSAYGDDTGTVVIAGNLQVDGLTTTINSTTLTVDDKNIVLASGAPNAAAADGAGIQVDITGVTNPEWNWYVNSVNTGVSAWESNYPIVITQSDASRTTNLHLVNETSGAGTEVALQMSVVSPANDACDVRLVAHRNGNNAGSDFYIETTNGSNAIERRFTIAEDGNVGIVTDSPGSKLEVYNSTTSGNTQLHIHNDKTSDAAVLRLEGKRTSLNDTGQVLFVNSGNVVAKIDARSADDDGALRFFTSATGTGSTISEAMSISTA